jgi:lipopolysaccharide biosynthesis protein
MKRLAIYAHFSETPAVARFVIYYLKELVSIGFEICFVSNSPVSIESQTEVSKLCQKIILRENIGLDFSMWKSALAQYDLSQFEELLLTNSSVIGPLQPLARLWRNSLVNEHDFWGLTDNDEISRHLQTYFVVFHKNVIQSDFFMKFWESVLPYKDKDQIIRSYEVGLTVWLEQNGFKWNVLYPQCEVFKRYIVSRKNRSFPGNVLDCLKRRGVPAQLPGRNTILYFPDLLVQSGMPFLKTWLLTYQPDRAYKLLESSALPKDALAELRAAGRRF